MPGRHFEKFGATKRYLYVPPCRYCGLPVFRGHAVKNVGLVCKRCDRNGLRDVIADSEPHSLRKVS